MFRTYTTYDRRLRGFTTRRRYHTSGRTPVAPAAPPLAPVAPVVTRCILTYRELLTDELTSPTPARLANFLQGYQFDGGAGVPTPTFLRDMTVTLSDQQPMAFLSLKHGPNGTHEVVIVHRFMRYLDMPGEEESGFHDRVLGLHGDISMPHQYPMVDLPGTVFHLVGNVVRVPTPMQWRHCFPRGKIRRRLKGPPIPETEIVQPRHLQLLPGCYTALFIHRGRGLTAKVVFYALYGAMQGRNEVAICADVTSWLKVTATARGGGGLQNGVPIVYHPLTLVHLPPEV